MRNKGFMAAVLGAAIMFLLAGCGEKAQDSAKFEGQHDLKIVATGVRSSGGYMRAMLCAPGDNFPNQCALAQDVEAKEGQVVWEFRSIPAGQYAFAAYHDENNDKKINFVDGRMPSEGLMFSNNVMGRAGPPSFKQSAFDLTKSTKMVVQAKYFNQNGE